jgi:putative polymerase
MTNARNESPPTSAELRGLMPRAQLGQFAAAQPINWPALAIIFSAVSFNYFLCFVNTNLVHISRLSVIGAEILIISIAFAVALPAIGRIAFILIGILFFYLMMLTIIRAVNGGPFDVKAVRDFMIPAVFFCLGAWVKDAKSADFIVRTITVAVIAAGLFEMLFLKTYLRYFDVINYYVMRGTVDLADTQYLANNLFVSGIRPEGRTLFGFLGDHRISSLFLEPVSPGNYGVIVFFWALVRSRAEQKLYTGLFLMSFLIIVMADNRLGAGLCILGLALAFVSVRYSYPVILILPFALIAMLLGMHSLFPHLAITDSTLGRLVFSGGLLSSLDVLNWMGFEDLPGTQDSGYSAVFVEIGILGFAVLWGLFMSIKERGNAFNYFRVLAGLYIAVSLCISYSLVTIKTAALLWFLVGVLAYAANERPRVVNVRLLS